MTEHHDDLILTGSLPSNISRSFTRFEKPLVNNPERPIIPISAEQQSGVVALYQIALGKIEDFNNYYGLAPDSGDGIQDLRKTGEVIVEGGDQALLELNDRVAGLANSLAAMELIRTAKGDFTNTAVVAPTVQSVSDAIAGGLFVYPVFAKDLIDKQALVFSGLAGLVAKPDTRTDLRTAFMSALFPQLEQALEILTRGYFPDSMQHQVDERVIAQVDQLAIYNIQSLCGLLWTANLTGEFTDGNWRTIKTYPDQLEKFTKLSSDAIQVILARDPDTSLAMLRRWGELLTRKSYGLDLRVYDPINYLRHISVPRGESSVKEVVLRVSGSGYVDTMAALAQRAADEKDITQGSFLGELARIISDSAGMRITSTETIFYALVEKLSLDQAPNALIDNLQAVGERQSAEIQHLVDELSERSLDEMSAEKLGNIVDYLGNMSKTLQATTMATVKLALHSTADDKKIRALVDKFVDAFIQASEDEIEPTRSEALTKLRSHLGEAELDRLTNIVE